MLERTLRDGSKIQPASSSYLINALGSILSSEPTIQVLHASIIDFFTDSNRYQVERFFIDSSNYHCELAIRCFQIMAGLKRDICEINDPTKWNSEIHELDKRLQTYVPEHLKYACCFWHRHLEHPPRAPSIFLQLN